MKLCPKCDSSHSKPGIFCSRQCANSRGPRSPEFKETVSQKLSNRKMTEERKLKISGEKNGAWKGGKHTKICKFCEMSYDTHHTKTKYCSQECWKSDVAKHKNERELYKLACAFKFDVYDRPDRFDISLVEKYGWYTASNRGSNQTGVQRDHMYSVADGFSNNVDPAIISHPANCKLLANFENQTKRSKSTISLSELLERIENWK